MSERRLVGAAAALSALIALAYVLLITQHDKLAGDALDYDAYGRFAAQGHWLWLDKLTGVPHPSAWKPPLYPLWVGLWYTLLGTHATAVEVVQALVLPPVTVVLTYLLARRFTRVAVPAAFLVALYPMAWQYTGLLYPEALAVPLTLAALLAGLGTEPTPIRAGPVGALVALNLFVRPTAFVLLAGIAVGWWVAAGFRRAAIATVVAAAVAAVLVAPLVLRNHHVTGAYMLSVQDAAVAGTFNPTSANDPEYPYAWRPLVPRDRDLLERPITEAELHEVFNRRAYRYIREHPASVPKAFFWNGITRFWDLRRPRHALNDAPFEGRRRGVAGVALAFYYVLGLLALAGLWRLRARRALVAALLALAVASSIVYTAVGGTRYRAPLEPVIAILACVGAQAVASRLRAGRDAPATGSPLTTRSSA